MDSIIFDIGATKTRIAYVGRGERFEEPKILPTPKSYSELLKNFIYTAKELADDRPIRSVCGGISRAVCGEYSKFRKDLEDNFGALVFVENDAAMAGLGEARYGAGKGVEILAYITVSTGVGGAKIVGGAIDEHSVGFEPGKQILDADSGTTWEEMISGKALEKREGKHPKDIKDPEVWDDLAKRLAIGLNNITVEWSPERIVLGGSMITGDPSIPLGLTQKYLKETLKAFPEAPELKRAELGDFGGIYGALAFLRS